MPKATNEQMELLHELAAKILIQRLESNPDDDKALQSAIRFLKENHIEADLADPGEGIALLTQTLPFRELTA